MSIISPDTVISRGTEHVETQVGAQTMMMSIAKGKYFALEDSGRHVWQLTEQPTTIAAIVDQLVAEYDVDREACLQDVTAFVNDLVSNGLVVVDGHDQADP